MTRYILGGSLCRYTSPGIFEHVAVEEMPQLIGRAGPVVNAPGVEIDVPSLLLHQRDHFRFVRTNPHHHARIAQLFTPFPDGIHFASLEGHVRLLTVVVNRHRLEGLVEGTEIAAALDDQMHATALGLKTLQVLKTTALREIVEGVDAETVALVENFTDPLRRVIVLHHPRQHVGVMALSIERIAADNQPADVPVEELHLRNLYRRCRAV
jgi:hypothetical protein